MPYYLCRGCCEYDDKALEDVGLSQCDGCNQRYCRDCVIRLCETCSRCEYLYCERCANSQLSMCSACDYQFCEGCAILSWFEDNQYCDECYLYATKAAKKKQAKEEAAMKATIEKQDIEEIANLAKEVDEKMVVE